MKDVKTVIVDSIFVRVIIDRRTHDAPLLLDKWLFYTREVSILRLEAVAETLAQIPLCQNKNSFSMVAESLKPIVLVIVQFALWPHAL
jgi:hypothetical protein